MRIQILGIDYAPDEIGTAVYTTGLSNELALRGHDVNVLCGLPYYPQWQIKDGWNKWHYKTEKNQENLTVTHCPLYVPNTPTAKKRILHYLSFAATALPRLIGNALRKRPDVIMVVAPSLISGLSAWVTARLIGAKLWLHIQDFEVEAAFATNTMSKDSKLGRGAVAFEKWMLRRFDLISSISTPMLDKLREKGVPEERIYEFRNWANLAKIKVLDRPSPLKAELGIETDFVAYYSGNLAAKQGLEILPKVAEHLAHRKDLTFVVCGEGTYLETLKKAAKGLENFKIFPLQPFEKLSEALGMANVHLLPQIADVAELVLPSKLTNMLASGRPVIATVGPDTAIAQEIKGAGITTPPGDARAMATALEELLDAPEQLSELGKQARKNAQANWDMNAIMDRLETRLYTLIDKHLPLAEGAEQEN